MLPLFLLFYNRKVINSWTLAKRDIGLHYLFTHYLSHLFNCFLPSLAINKHYLFQIAPSTLHQGTGKLSTKHVTAPTCLAHLVLTKSERPKVAVQWLWLRAKYVLCQIGQRVNFLFTVGHFSALWIFEQLLLNIIFQFITVFFALILTV